MSKLRGIQLKMAVVMALKGRGTIRRTTGTVQQEHRHSACFRNNMSKQPIFHDEPRAFFSSSKEPNYCFCGFVFLLFLGARLPSALFVIFPLTEARMGRI